MTPSSAPPLRSSQPSATSRSRGRRATAAGSEARCWRRIAPSRSRRSDSGARVSGSPSELEQVEQHQLAGVSRGELARPGSRRDAGAAAARRTTSTSPTGMTSSPSSTKRFVRSAREHVDDLGEIAPERLARLGLQLDLVAVAEGEAAEAVPLGLVLPAVALGQLGGEQGFHRRRVSVVACPREPFTWPGGPSAVSLRLRQGRRLSGSSRSTAATRRGCWCRPRW